MTTLDNRRAELDARMALLQQEIDALQATLDRLNAERRELDDYVSAVDPKTGKVRLAPAESKGRP